jgi:hypothetical protein
LRNCTVAAGTPKPIVLTDDNWADHFSDEYPESLVRGLAVGEGGIDRDSGVVALLLECVAERNQHSRAVR